MSEEPWIEERPVVIDAEVTHVTPEAFPALPSSEENNKKDSKRWAVPTSKANKIISSLSEGDRVPAAADRRRPPEAWGDRRGLGSHLSV
jgi:hypothetical protein